MSQTTTPPLDPILSPDLSRPNLTLAMITKKKSVRPTGKRRSRKPKEKLYTLEQAFDYFHGPTEECPEFQNERAVRAIAFLLHYFSEEGNEDVDGYVAHGLGQALEISAAKIAQASARRLYLREKDGAR